jgi:hypothetical protein
VRAWAGKDGIPAAEIAGTLARIEAFGCFVPGAHDPERDWWVRIRVGTEIT